MGVVARAESQPPQTVEDGDDVELVWVVDDAVLLNLAYTA